MTELLSRLKVLAVGLALLGAGTAQAASISYYMNQSNVDPFLPNGVNYLQVTISDAQYGADAEAIRFDVTVLSPLSSIAGSNFGVQSFGFNANLHSGQVLNAITGLPTGWSKAVNRNQSGFGRFELVNSGTGQTRQFPTLTFFVSGIAGDTPASYVAFSAGNSGLGHQFFAAHVAGFLDQDPGSGELTSAFFAGSSFAPQTVVPVPAAAWFLASGLGFLGFLRRRDA